MSAKTRTRLLFCAVAVVVSLIPSLLFALSEWTIYRGEVGKNDNWPQGLRELANRQERVYGYGRTHSWGQEDVFFYAGDTAAFNDFLAGCAKLEKTDLQLIIHPGPKRARTPWDEVDREIPVDWSLTISPPPLDSGRLTAFTCVARIDLFLGRSVGLEGLQVSAKIGVQSSGELEAFVARHVHIDLRSVE